MKSIYIVEQIEPADYCGNSNAYSTYNKAISS